MVLEREVIVEGTSYCVVISDEQEALLAAKAAGRVFVGLLREDVGQDLSGVSYLVESLEAVDEIYLEHVVRRKLGLPWIIGESERLYVREFMLADLPEIPQEPGDTEADRIFHSEEKLTAYIRSQYRFFEYGIWAVVRKSDGVIVGKAGVTDALWPEGEESQQPDMRLELGYHIFRPYRGHGYAQEAGRIVLRYVSRELTDCVYAVAAEDNVASNHILQKLGFRKLELHGAEPHRSEPHKKESCAHAQQHCMSESETGQLYTNAAQANAAQGFMRHAEVARSHAGTAVSVTVQKCTESEPRLCRYVWN